jgi:predicted house-cleaning noncanonical NTP pyrophosphatase (MazG superfamily)
VGNGETSAMKKIHYNKLVRDGIPEELEKLGKAFEVHLLGDEAYEKALFEKLAEETMELQGASTKQETVKEIADVLEVIDAIKSLKGISAEEIEVKKEEKFKKRGGFLKRIMLLWSEDDGYEAKKTS